MIYVWVSWDYAYIPLLAFYDTILLHLFLSPCVMAETQIPYHLLTVTLQEPHFPYGKHDILKRMKKGWEF